MRITLLLTLLLPLALVACDEGPTERYYGMVTAAEMGDREGFLNGFNEKSQKLIAAQISLSEAYDGIDDPIKQLVFERVDSVEEVGEGRVVLDVMRGTVRKRILMVKDEEKGWIIDVNELAKFWNEDK